MVLNTMIGDKLMEPLVTLNELARLLNKSKVTVWRWWAKDKTLPPPIQYKGRTLGWKKETIEKWLLEQ